MEYLTDSDLNRAKRLKIVQMNASKLSITVAMETMIFSVITSLSLITKIHRIFRVPMNDLALKKLTWGCKVGQISSWGISKRRGTINAARNERKKEYIYMNENVMRLQNITMSLYVIIFLNLVLRLFQGYFSS